MSGTQTTQPAAEPATRESRPEPIYRMLSRMISARRQCFSSHNDLWFEKWTYAIGQLAKDLLPSGAGIDAGTKVDLERSTGNKIVLTTSYHHMDCSGGYDGWTEHTVTVRPSLLFEIELTISGRDVYSIKEYLGDVFQQDLLRPAIECYEPATDKTYFRLA